MGSNIQTGLSSEQENEGYRLEIKADYALLWYYRNQIGLLIKNEDLKQKVQSLVESHQLRLQSDKARF